MTQHFVPAPPGGGGGKGDQQREWGVWGVGWGVYMMHKSGDSQ